MIRLALLLACLAAPALAHKESDGYLDLRLGPGGAEGTLDLHIADLDAALGLDADGDGLVRKGEVRAAEARIAAHAAERLSMVRGGADCAPAFGPGRFVVRSDGPYLSLPLAFACARDGAPAFAYRFFFDIDTRHRGRIVLREGERVEVQVASPGRERIEPRPASPAALAAGLFVQGVLHILEGIDHVLFVLTLLLGAMRAESVGAVLRGVGLLVTAFTLSHSVTLALASFGVLRPDPALVEAAIAATVVLAALNVIRPMVTRRLWAVALLFGFIHGFGFAAVLAGLDLPPGAFALALLAFNLGVEAGQAMIVAAVLPLLLLARQRPALLRAAAVGGAAVIALAGASWFSDRAFGTALGPF